jgi:hypothetical protein
MSPYPKWGDGAEVLLEDVMGASNGAGPEVEIDGATDIENPFSGLPMDPAAEPAERLPSLPGIPFLYRGMGAVIAGPTGGGRSSLIQACLYDGVKAGLRCAYLGSEVTYAEFNARAAILAGLRGDIINDELRATLADVRYLELAQSINVAWQDPETWTASIAAAYDIVVIDPLSTVSSALGLDFDKGNNDFVRFYDKLIQPVVSAGIAVPMFDNVGHAAEAKKRAAGASAKGWKPDLSFWCKPLSSPDGLIITAEKVRSVRAGHVHGDQWASYRDTQLIAQLEHDTHIDHGGGTADFRPTSLMERSSRAIEDTPGLGKRSVRTTVGGNAKAGWLALDLLIAEGFVEVRESGEQKQALHPIKPYRQSEDPLSDVYLDPES